VATTLANLLQHLLSHQGKLMIHYSPHQPIFMPARFTWKKIQGWFTFEDVYREQLKRMKGHESVMVEVGSWMGQSTAFAADLIKYNKLPVKFYAVDTWEGSPNEKHHQQVVAQNGGSIFDIWQENMVRCGVQDFVTPIKKPSVEAAQDFADGSIDFVFIDAAHDYDSVKSDIQSWLCKVKGGGCIGGHDINELGVRKAVVEQFGDKWRTVGISWLVEVA